MDLSRMYGIHNDMKYCDKCNGSSDPLAKHVCPLELTKEQLLELVGNFSWSFGNLWHIETEKGNFIWNDPTYGDGDNTFQQTEMTVKEFCQDMGIDFCRDKGKHPISNYCGQSIKLKENGRIVEFFNLKKKSKEPVNEVGPETVKFLAWVEKEKKNGLKSINFFTVDLTNATVESFCKDVNAMLEAPEVHIPDLD